MLRYGAFGSGCVQQEGVFKELQTLIMGKRCEQFGFSIGVFGGLVFEGYHL